MSFATNDGLQIYYDAYGFDDGAPLVLLHGLGSQVLFFHEEFCHSLVDRGFYVIRIDLRDSGLSSAFDRAEGYSLSDVAGDVLAVLDALDLNAAHIVGQSLGGMVAQTVALEHIARCASLTSISSNSGNLDIGKPTDDAMTALLSPPAADPASEIERAVRTRRVWASPSWWDEDETRAYFEACQNAVSPPTVRNASSTPSCAVAAETKSLTRSRCQRSSCTARWIHLSGLKRRPTWLA